jgi:putative transposase
VWVSLSRKRSHGELANRILGQGTTVKTEKLSYKAWQQQRYGKSLKVRAPGMFVRMLERMAATGGELIEFATRNTCLSRFCHVGDSPAKQSAAGTEAPRCSEG